MSDLKKIGILINGGDAPGLNAVIRAIIKTARVHGIESYGFIEGFKGLVENRFIQLEGNPLASGIIQKGGAIIGSSLNTNVFNYKVIEDGNEVYKDLSDVCVQNLRDDGFDCLFTLGGDSTQKAARDLSLKGIRVIGVPKTIDNDVAGTDMTFGYNTAVSVATDAIDRLHTTAETHNRIMVLEVMGRYAGWIALESAIAGGADVALIPEIPFDLDKVVEAINNRKARGKNFSIMVVSEGARPKNGDLFIKGTREGGEGVINIQLGGAGEYVAKEIEARTGMTARNTTLGYLQRGGTPSATDRVLSTEYGAKAMELALEGKFNVLAVLKNGKMDSIPLEEVIGNNKEIGAVEGGTEESNMKTIEMNDDLVKTARNIGICLGD